MDIFKTTKEAKSNNIILIIICIIKSLAKAPTIPEGVTSLICTFAGCSSLTETPIISENVTIMQATFYGCSSLTEAPVIPASVTNMHYTFYDCYNLQGDLVIHATPSSYSHCLYGAAIKGDTLYLSCTSTILNEILATKSSSGNIVLKP